jgi:hypothetical protein
LFTIRREKDGGLGYQVKEKVVDKISGADSITLNQR